MNNTSRSLLLAGILLVSAGALHAQAVKNKPASPAPSAVQSANRTFPFLVNEKTLTATVNLRDPRVEKIYNTMFRKYLYTGNYKTWDDMIEEILEEKDVDFAVMNKLDYNSEDNLFSVTAGSKEEMEKFLSIVQPVFATISKLESFIKRVDPAHIVDGSHQPEGDQ